MTTVSYPGVYVEEIPGGARPIEAANTSTTAFVGVAEKGPDDEAQRLTSWDEYQRVYGGFIQGSYLAESVFQFFNNGGRQCYVVRVTPSDAAAANLTVQNRAPNPVAGVEFSAHSKGAWGNYLALTIEDGTNDPGNEIKVTVRRQEVADVLPADILSQDPLEEHDDLSMDRDAPNFIEKVIARDSALIKGSVPATNNSLQRGRHTSGVLQVGRAECDLRRPPVAHDETARDQIVNEFEKEFERKKEECAVLIVGVETAPDVWTLAGFDDAGDFKKKDDIDANHELGKDLQKQPQDENKIIELATTTLGRTLTDRLQPPLTAEERRFLISVDHDGYQEVVIPDTVNGADLNKIADAITSELTDLKPPQLKDSTPAAAFIGFACRSADVARRFVLTSGSGASGSVQVHKTQETDLAEVWRFGGTAGVNGTHASGLFAVDGEGKTLKTPLSPAERLFRINVDGDGFQDVSLPPDVDGADPADIAKGIQEAVRVLTKLNPNTPEAAFTYFACANMDAQRVLMLTSGTNDGIISADDDGATPLSSVQVQNAPQTNAAAMLRLGAANGGLSEGALAVRRPARIPDRDVHGLITAQLGDNAETRPISGAPTPGADGNTSTLNPQHHAEAFRLLNDKTDFSLLAVPGIGLPTMTDLGVTYCENRPLRDVFYIGETEWFTDTPAEAVGFRNALTKANSFGAVYFPWVRALDPSGRSPEAILLPPSGYVAGLYARIDSTRGVWKAPAGTEASLSGVVGLATNLTDIQQGNLNRRHVNCIRRFDAAGVVSWGARTITSDPEWKYVPVRRTAIMLRRSIYDGIQWAVFEPNDHRLWSALRTNIGAFMNGLFRAGAFQGEKASDAYFVRCGLGDTMTQGDIDRGQVIVLVGFAALKPAEFVIVRIQQKAGQNQ